MHLKVIICFLYLGTKKYSHLFLIYKNGGSIMRCFDILIDRLAFHSLLALDILLSIFRSPNCDNILSLYFQFTNMNCILLDR